MNEKPILFSAPMVNAVLTGYKTQTRRTTKLDHPMNDLPDNFNFIGISNKGSAAFENKRSGQLFVVKSPYGNTGDQLWVREAWRQAYPKTSFSDGIIYRADTHRSMGMDEFSDRHKWKPSIHMFRKHSRIDLAITDIRVERLQDISEDDAISEGVLPNCNSAVFGKGGWIVEKDNGCPHQETSNCETCLEDGHFVEWQRYPEEEDSLQYPAYSAKESFESLWESINGRGSWNKNPWLWCVDFKRCNHG